MKLNIALFLIMMAAGFLAATLLQTRPPSGGGQVIHTQLAPGIKIGGALPAFTMTTLDGKTLASGDLAGKTIVINFWATWCPPCIVEFPRLLEIAAARPDDLILLAISSDHEIAAINRFIARMSAENKKMLQQDNVVIVTDPDSAITFDIFQTTRLPETIIVNPQQQMIHKLVGADWTKEDIAPFIAPDIMPDIAPESAAQN